MLIVKDTLTIIEQMSLYDKVQGQYIPFLLWDRQKEFLDCIHNHRKVIILKKRQTGISQLTGADSLAQCMTQHNYTVLVLSKTGDDAKEYLNRVRDMYHSLGQVSEVGEALKDYAPLVKDTQEEMKWANGSRIISLPANRGAGYTANRVILDEAAFITKTDSKIDLATVLKRVEPTLDKSEGQLILISTANGMNLFQQYYMRAKQKLSNIVAFFFSCWDDPTFNESKRQEIIEDHGEDHANQEYPRTDLEAFLSSGRPRFDRNALNYYLENRITGHKFQGMLVPDSNEIISNEKGNFRIKHDKDPKGQYLIISDVAEGLDHGDYSHVKVFCRRSWKIVAEWHDHIEPHLLGTIMVKLGYMYNNALLCPEANNHGIATLTQIREKEKYPEDLIFEHNLVTREKSDDDFKTPVPRYGWRTTPKTRPLIIDTLGKLLIHYEIPELSPEDLDELQTFIWKNGKPQAEEGCFDDRVMVLCIGYYLLSSETFNAYHPIIEPKPHERCSTCQYCVKEYPEDKRGNCQYSGRVVKSNQFCHLYQKFQWDWTEINPNHTKDVFSDYVGI